MKKILVLVVLAVIFSGAAPVLAEGRSDTVRKLKWASMDYRAQTATGTRQAPSAGLGGRPMIIIVAPGFDYYDHGAISGIVGDTALKSRSGHGEAGSLTFRAIKPFSDLFSFGFFYQIAYGSYSGGLMVPATGGSPGFSFDGWSDVHVVANVVGLTADFNFGTYGKLETAVLGAFESFGGSETMLSPGGLHTFSADSFQDRIFSLTGFYSKDFDLGGVTLTPYLGWRSVHVVLINQTDYEHDTLLPNSSSWSHFGATGLKATWHFGPWGLTGRLGVNHRFSKGDVPGWASRAMAPGVTHLGWQVAWDRTVPSWGLGVSYVIPGSCIIDLGYNGLAGPDTQAHSLALGLIFPF